MTETSATSPTQDLMHWLIEHGIITAQRAQNLVVDCLPDHAIINSLMHFMRSRLSESELLKDAKLFQERKRVERESREAKFAGMDPATRAEAEFIYEIENLDEWGSSSKVCRNDIDEEIKESAVLRLFEDGLTANCFLEFANGVIGQDAILTVLCQSIDEHNLGAALEERFADYKSSPSLTSLIGHSNRFGLSREQTRRLAITFAEQEGNHAVARILCDEIIREGASAEFRKDCERCLHFGIRRVEHEYLKIREQIPSAELDIDFFAMSFGQEPWVLEDDDDDRFRERPWEGFDLSRRAAVEGSESLDADELVKPVPNELGNHDLLPTLPLIGSPTSLDRLSPFESLQTLHAAGLLSSIAMRGFAVRFVEFEKAEADCHSLQAF